MGAAAFGLLEIAVRVAIIFGRHMTPSLSDVLTSAFDMLALTVGLTAVFALLSSLVKGLGDFGIWVLIQIVLPIAVKAGLPEKVSEFGHKFLFPQLTWLQLSARPVEWTDIGFYFATIVVCLGLAMVVMERKELSYASSA